MRKIMTLVLMMLIGGYGAAHGQSKGTINRAGMVMEDATKTEEETNKFLGLEWGLGIGVIGSLGGEDAIEKASIVEIGTAPDSTKIIHVEEEGDMRPQVFVEMHVFVNPRASEWRSYQRGKSADRMAEAMKVDRKKVEDPQNPRGAKVAPGDPEMPDPPLMGVGPFIALQGSDDEVINSLAVGVMWGFRRDPQKSNSLNFGIGVSFDPSVQVLAKKFKDGDSPPNGETAVRFKKEGRFGWALMASFTF